MGSSILVGVVSGIISSITFSLILLLIRPNLKVSDQVSYKILEDGKWECKIKLVNKSYSMLTNVKYALYYCKEGNDGIHSIEEIYPRKKPIISIQKYTMNRNNTDYAIRLTYDINPKVYEFGEGKKLIFYIVCNHSLSGTMKSIQKEYKHSDIIRGIFESDMSMKILETEMN